MNSKLYQWAIRHQVSIVALEELQELFGLHGGHRLPPTVKGDSESAVQSAIRVEAASKGVRLFRNNVGVLKDLTGRPVRYGLANDSNQLNRVLKSGDLIGWRPLRIEPRHVGTTLALFVSRECKPLGWRYTGTDHERAQLAWAQLIMASGGDAAFCTGVGTL